MKERENAVARWFAMWLQKTDLGIEEIFSEDVLYVESWGPEYRGRRKVKQWFEEWNTRGSVLEWEIRQYFHKENQTVVEWYFRNRMDDGRAEEFEGMSLIRWTEENQICFLQEFGCNLQRYDPYREGTAPKFSGEKAKWF